MTNAVRWTLFFVVAAALVACGVMDISPENQSALMQHFNEELAAGRISQAQYDVLVESLTTPKMGWEDWLAKGLEWIGIITGAVLVNNKVRGPSATKAERAKRAQAKLEEAKTA